MNRFSQKRPRNLTSSKSHRQNTPFHGVIICDVDGTLAKRDQPIGMAAAKALARVTGVGWKVVILTGQPLSNIRPRLVPNLRKAFRKTGSNLGEIRLFTCEGSSEWRIIGDRCVKVTNSDTEGHLSTADRSLVTGLLRANLAHMMPRDVRLHQAPLWAEGAMCFIKFDACSRHRLLIANRLRKLLLKHGLKWLRVGTPGTSTIIITHRLTNKGTALSRILEPLRQDESAFYLADEFDGSGNDVPALRIRELICINIGRACAEAGASGPRSVVRWLYHMTVPSSSAEIDRLRISRI